MRVQRFGEHRAMPWANGKGTSYEIASDRDGEDRWSWRLAIAPVVLDGPFSALPGIDRELVVIEGNGMVLEVDGTSVECLPGQVVRFSGDAKTFARLIDGPVFDLGLITARGSVTGLMVVADVGAVIESDLFVAIGGSVFEDESKKIWELEPMDALLGMAGHQMVLLSGTAIAIHVNS
jgi:environmental stress-induced protein Ves